MKTLFYRALSSLCCVLLLGAIWNPSRAAAQTDEAIRPNIIFILVDDLGYGDVGAFGQQMIPTPHLDRMAEQGMRFMQHYAGSTVCAPSRATLLSGQHTGHVWQRGNGRHNFRPDPQDICFASHLQESGYATAMIGKSGLSGHSEDGAFPNTKGFDYFFGFVSHRAAHRHYPQLLWRNGEPVHYPDNHGREGVHYTGDLFTVDALQWIRDHHEQPFFLHFALQNPHADLHVPDEWRQMFVGQFDESPYEGAHYRAERYPRSTFAGMIAHLDDSVGQVLALIEELGIEENTLVIFTSDNGPHNVGGHDHNFFNSNGPFRGIKRDLYEGGIRVPTIAWWPGTVEAGGETDHISAFWDFAPTAIELAGARPMAQTDGISYVPTLLGEGEQAVHEYLYWEFHERGGKQAVRMGDWKAVRLNARREANSPIELYNLASDPGEQHNVADQHPDIVRQMQRIMHQAHVPIPNYQLGR